MCIYITKNYHSNQLEGVVNKLIRIFRDEKSCSHSNPQTLLYPFCIHIHPHPPFLLSLSLSIFQPSHLFSLFIMFSYPNTHLGVSFPHFSFLCSEVITLHLTPILTSPPKNSPHYISHHSTPFLILILTITIFYVTLKM